MEINKKTTARGFDVSEFKDLYGSSCSIQKSSVMHDEQPCVWIGINEAKPMIMESKIKEDGVGWVKYPIPEDVFINTRMHLSRDQVRELIPILQKFVDTGEL